MTSKEGRGPIEKWSTYKDAFEAPELHPSVQGVFADGRHVLTSRLVRAEGRRVWTEGGHEYELGEPDPLFVEWLTSHDYQFDPANPIRLVDKPSNLAPPKAQSILGVTQRTSEEGKP